MVKKTVKSEAQKRRKPKKCVSAAIEQNTLKANSSPPAPTRYCFARICCPRSLLHILIGIRFFSRTVHSRTLPFPLWKNRCTLANYGFATVVDALKLAGLWHLGCIAGKVQCYGSTKNQLSGATIWQLRSGKLGKS
jgi:hypothetical protein